MDVTRSFKFEWFGGIRPQTLRIHRISRNYHVAHTGISQFECFGSSPKRAEIGPHSFGIVAGLWVPCFAFGD